MRNQINKIVMAQITPLPKKFGDPMPRVIATFDDDTTKELFEYYPDEISFTSEEFIGLTEVQAYQLKFNKDKKYLQS